MSHENLNDGRSGSKAEVALCHLYVHIGLRSGYKRLLRGLDGEASVCVTDPGFEIGLVVTADLSAFYQVWLGKMTLRQAVAEEFISIEGIPAFERAFPNWFLWSPMAKLVSTASARDKKLCLPIWVKSRPMN